MRDYAKISPAFWTGQTGRRLRSLGPECQILALYLITCHHANMLGLYYLPVAYVSADTGLTIEGALKGLATLSEAGFCKYDPPSEWVFVISMARFQVLKNGEPLNREDKRVLGINKEYASMPTNPFLLDFFECYASLFHISAHRGTSPLQAPCKPLASQEQEQEQEQEQTPPSLSLAEFRKIYRDCIGVELGGGVNESISGLCRAYTREKLEQGILSVSTRVPLPKNPFSYLCKVLEGNSLPSRDIASAASPVGAVIIDPDRMAANRRALEAMGCNS